MAAVALHYMHYNFCRVHSSLRTEKNNRVTPAELERVNAKSVLHSALRP